MTRGKLCSLCSPEGPSSQDEEAVLQGQAGAAAVLALPSTDTPDVSDIVTLFDVQVCLMILAQIHDVLRATAPGVATGIAFASRPLHE